MRRTIASLVAVLALESWANAGAVLGPWDLYLHGTWEYTTEFRGGEEAWVKVYGVTHDFTVRVYDSNNRLVARETTDAGDDRCTVKWTPPVRGFYKITCGPCAISRIQTN
jgi:hypothetical protein